MHAVRRRVLTIVSMASLALCLLVASIRARSDFRNDEFFQASGGLFPARSFRVASIVDCVRRLRDSSRVLAGLNSKPVAKAPAMDGPLQPVRLRPPRHA
jgi:hypothetical protein